MSDVADKRMHLDIMFEMFHCVHASCWLTNLISVFFFLVKPPILCPGCSAFMRSLTVQSVDEGRRVNVQCNSAGVDGALSCWAPLWVLLSLADMGRPELSRATLFSMVATSHMCLLST